MTVEQLNATPLFSTVVTTSQYQSTEGVLIKINNGMARMFSSASGWISAYLPASELTLIQVYTRPTQAIPPTNIAAAPLYSYATVEHTDPTFLIPTQVGVLIEKRNTHNTWTNQDYWTGMVWIGDTETYISGDDTIIHFHGSSLAPPVVPPVIPPVVPPVIPPVVPPVEGKTQNMIMWGAIAIGAYLLFIKKDKHPTA
jgi:hypothetical protein